MKKLISLLMIVIMSLSLCACQSEEKQREKIDEFVASYFVCAEYRPNESQFSKYQDNPYFVEAIVKHIENLKDSMDFETAHCVMEILAEKEFESEQISTAYEDFLKAYKAYVFEEDDVEGLVEKLMQLPALEDKGYYGAGPFNKDDFISYFEENGKLTKTSSDDYGYYKKNASKYKDKAYWYSPLKNKRVSKGEFGTYKVEVDYTFYGDFAESEESKKWWTHDGSSTADDFYYHTMDYKGESLADDLDETYLDTVDIIPGNAVYYFEEEGSAWSDYFAVVLEDQIIMFKGSGYDDIVIVLE